MPTVWNKSVKSGGTLTYFNDGGSWGGVVDKAAATFNSLGFPVKFNKTKEKGSANVVIKLSMGPDHVDYSNGTVNTPANFSPDFLLGRTVTQAIVMGNNPPELEFAATFLPGKATGTPEQKEVIIVHEMIHACGLDGGRGDGTYSKDQDHDSEGILYFTMSPKGKGLVENNAPNANAMPPIRIGGQTMCKILAIWDPKGCPKP